MTAAGDRTAIVTGASSGLGLACAGALLAADPAWHVVLAVRDPERGRAVAAGLGAPGRTTVAELDLASLASVRRFVAGYPARGLPPTRAIVCNAGLQLTTDEVVRSPDGVELTFATNHLGHFALTIGLVDGLTAPARVLVVASDTHDPARRTGMPRPAYTTAQALADPPAGERVAGRRRYTTSKLCNVLFAYELDRRLDHGGRGIAVNAFNPGLMPGSGLARNAGRVQRFAWHALLPALRVLPMVSSPARSGARLAALAGDAKYDGVTGRYFDGLKEVRSSTDSYNLDFARDLWDVSAALSAAAV